MRRTHTITALAVAAASVAAAGSVAAQQNVVLPSMLEKGVWIEATHASLKDVDVSLPSTVWTIAGRVPVGSRFGVNVDVPFSYAKFDLGEAGEESSSVLGNPYVGVDVTPIDRLVVEVGTRLPLNTIDEESLADVFAALSDPFRAEAFLDETVPVLASATYTHPLPAGFGLRARAGVATLVDTSDDEDADTDTALDYGVAGTYTTGPAQLALSVVGRWDVSADEGDFAENSFHQAALTADVQVGPVRPGIAVRLPLDSDFRDYVESSVGLYLRVPMP